MQNDADWRPTREIELVAGTPAGGGQDRPARALIEVLTSLKLVEQPVKLTNIPGRGGGNAWDYLRDKSGDAHVLAINSPTIISNKLLGVSAYDYAALTPLANLYTEYPIFIVRAGSPLADAAALERRLKADIKGLRVALATAIGNTNHIALAQVGSDALVNRDLSQLALDAAARISPARLQRRAVVLDEAKNAITARNGSVRLQLERMFIEMFTA